MSKGYRVEFRCAEEAGVWVEAAAVREGVSRSEMWRDVMRKGLALYDKPSSSQPGLSKQDEVELRWWRGFADRTVVNGDLDKQVVPGIDLPGWTFHVMPAYDEHLKGIA